MADLMELREKQQKLIHDAREALDQIDDKTDEARAKELEEQHDRAMADWDKLNAQAERQQKLNEAEQRMINSSIAPEVPDNKRDRKPEPTARCMWIISVVALPA